jgi:hypothetical protein
MGKLPTIVRQTEISAFLAQFLIDFAFRARESEGDPNNSAGPIGTC